MAEEEKKKIISRIFPIKNLFKRILRRILPSEVAKPHYTITPGISVEELPTFKKLDQELKFKVIEQLNQLEIKTERDWEGSKGEDIGNVRKFYDEILHHYTATRWDTNTNTDVGEISDGIGPFTDRNMLLKERDYADLGTGIAKETIIVNKNGGQITGEFHIPALKPMIYEDGRGGKDASGNDNVVAYNVAFFGQGNNKYWGNLDREIKKICGDVKQAALSGTNDPIIKSNITEHITFAEEVTTDMAAAVKIFTRALEEKHRAGLNAINNHYNTLEPILGKIYGLKLTEDQVHYTHTFKVVKPVIRDGDGNEIARLQNGMGSYFKRPEEVDYGLDEHGWPLEVGDDTTKFDGRILKKGEVLVDIYINDWINMEIQNKQRQLNEEQDPDKRTQLQNDIAALRTKIHPAIRVVPEEFIVDCDPLDIVTWIYVYYDAYRDDLRDGRYHKGAITILERIMTELGVKGHTQTMKDIENGRHARIRMNLNRLPGGGNPGRFATDPQSVEMTIVPRDRLPAFDLRAIDVTALGKELNKKKTKHLGRIYYYETQNESVQKDAPTITTRGAAMYILHRVIEETKYWEDIEKILAAIGEKTDGYDIGPNMGVEEKGWGKKFTRHPLKPFRG